MRNMMVCLLAILTINVTAATTEGSSDSGLTNRAMAWYAAIEALSVESATSQDIDTIFSLVTDDFVYEHPKYGGMYTKAQLYEGFKANFARGAYKKSKPTKIVNTIEGLNMVVVERDKNKVTLFEFEEGRIAGIKEYW